MSRINSGIDRQRGAGIKLQNVLAQAGRCLIEVMRGELGQQVCVGFIRKRVFARLGFFTVIEIAVGQRQLARAHFCQQNAVIIGGCVETCFELRFRTIPKGP